jgi:hypothetical protein
MSAPVVKKKKKASASGGSAPHDEVPLDRQLAAPTV